MYMEMDMEERPGKVDERFLPKTKNASAELYRVTLHRLEILMAEFKN